MRPLIKLAPGTHSMPDGSQLCVQKSYANYHHAKPALVANLGIFCSYCEEAYHQQRDLHVEHVQPKGYKEQGIKIYAHLATEWSNFLLSCSTCNGNDNKDTKNVILAECHLPHINNTFKSFVYKAGGVVEINPNLGGISYTHAQALYHLVRLDKSPKTSCPGDTRCNKRKIDWDMASRYRDKYDKGKTSVEDIVNFVQNRGGWSIWFTVFKGCDAVRQALLEFPGTAKNCFDPANNYEPINRNPGLPDPV